MNSDTLAAVVGAIGLLSFGMWYALKPRLSAPRSQEPELGQPVPDVTPEDVQRVIRRDFPSVRSEDVLDIVSEYSSPWESSIPRVQLAALKLADAHLDSLRRYIDAAKQDYRDVLVPAEYPKYWKATSRRRGLPKNRRQLFASDRKQYEKWLRR